MMDRWIGLGGLGWVNIVEQLLDGGLRISDANLAHLRTIHRRLGAVVDRAAQQPPDAEIAGATAPRAGLPYSVVTPIRAGEGAAPAATPARVIPVYPYRRGEETVDG